MKTLLIGGKIHRNTSCPNNWFYHICFDVSGRKTSRLNETFLNDSRNKGKTLNMSEFNTVPSKNEIPFQSSTLDPTNIRIGIFLIILICIVIGDCYSVAQSFEEKSLPSIRLSKSAYVTRGGIIKDGLILPENSK